ncbi:glycoside hydrolase family 2 protein [Streptomyces sp. NPDC051684]|uniref:glycoside hydrolase family 2 protein n=1 Tax=Streptomyces sp. NPDC051684 TaxID=3365670 RepID=UPI0037B75E3E
MHRDEISRASFLRGAAAAASLGALAAVGVPGTAAATPTAPGEDAGPGPGAGPDGGPPQPQEHGWQPKTPRLTTPWTADVSPHSARTEYPRPQLRREHWLSLNGVWQFAAAEPGERPHPGRELDERILVPYPVESALSGIMRHEPRMFYQRRFTVPPGWGVGPGRDTDHRLLLHLDGVDHRAEVLVNGRSLGVHEGAYDRFTVDVTDALDHGDHGAPAEQELVVVVDDPTDDGVQPLGKQRLSALDPESRHSSLYYSPVSGIWQPVWLEPVPAAYVQGLSVVPDIDARTATVTVDVAGDDRAEVELTLHHEGRAVATVHGRTGDQLTVPVEPLRLWTPDDPFLYRLDVRVAGGSGGDRVSHPFGMRTVGVEEVAGAPRLTLNGEFLPQVSCLQQGYWPDGLYTAATDDALRFDVEEAKKLGFTTIRKHVKTEPDRWYHWADRLGVLVWQDMPSTATGRQPPTQTEPSQPPAAGKERFERELSRVVRQLSAFTSIVMWIPFNEGWGAYDLARVAAQVREWDPTRVVNEMSGTNVADYEEGGGQVADLHNLRGVTGPAPKPGQGRAAVIGEFGAYAYPPQGHEYVPGHSDPNQDVAGAAELTERYVAAMRDLVGFIRDEGLSGANYNLFEDAELQVNGLYSYDRRVFKPSDRDRVIAANRSVVATARRLR